MSRFAWAAAIASRKRSRLEEEFARFARLVEHVQGPVMPAMPVLFSMRLGDAVLGYDQL
jgi:hypothetical protein